MGKYQVRYEDDNFQVKNRETNDGYTTIIENKDEDCSETYTSIHEGEDRDTVVHTHYDDGSSTYTVFDEDGNLVNQYEEDADGNTKDAMPDDDWESDDDD